MTNKSATSFTIRIRFRIPAGHRIGVEEASLAFTTTVGSELILKSAEQGKTIHESEWLILQSSGWDSVEAAQAESVQLMDALRRALISHHIGVDLGYRACHGGGFSEAVIDQIERKSGRPVLIDTHGPMVHASAPPPLFSSIEGTGGWPPVRKDRFEKTFSFAVSCRAPLSDRERTAFDLFCAARHVRESKDARFLLLFASFEALLETSPRPKPIVDYVDLLIALTEKTALDTSEKDSILGLLRWMRSHSIRHSGRNLVNEHLAGRDYRGRSAERLFLDCYDLRNRLIHGGQPYPTPLEVTGLVEALDSMLCDLLKGPLLHFDVT